MNIQVNICAVDGEYYGVYQLARMDKSLKWLAKIDIQDGEICWRFVSFNVGPHPTIYVDDDDLSHIKFKSEHLSGN